MNMTREYVGREAAAPIEHTALAPLPGRSARATPTLGQIIHVVCRTLGVGFDELAGTNRRPQVVLARALISRLARRLTALSYPEIARGIGRPTHTTIIAANERFRRRLESDPPETIDLGGEVLTLAELVGRLEAGITGAKR